MEPFLPADSTLRVIVVSTDLICLVVGVVQVLRARTPREATNAWALGPVAAGIIGIAAARIAGFGGFAYMRVVEHALWFVGTPLLLVLAASALRRGSWALTAVSTVAALFSAFIYVWSHFVEPYALEITTHRITTASLPKGSPTIRIVVLADLQTDEIGSYELAVFERIAELQPDLLVLPGDFIQLRGNGFFAEHAKLLAALRRLPRPRLGICAVEGDIDPMRSRGADPASFFDDGAGLAATLLDDEFVELEETGIQILGLGLSSSRRSLPDEWVERIRSFDGLSLVVGHAPEFALPTIQSAEASGGPDFGHDVLFLAGHTHGGQVVIPGFGPPITLSSLPRRVAGGGLHRFGDAYVCVSRGVGMERGFAPRLRLFCRPELVVFELSPAE